MKKTWIKPLFTTCCLEKLNFQIKVSAYSGEGICRLFVLR